MRAGYDVGMHAVESMPVEVPRGALTHAGFREWAVSDEFPETGSIAYIKGAILLDMTAERLKQNDVKTYISRGVLNLVVKERLGRFYSDKTLLTNVRAGVSNEPDGMYASWDTLRSGRLVPVLRSPHQETPEMSKELEGTPDWVLEVVSPTSVRKDTKLLRGAYFDAGIPEYWLADAVRERAELSVLVRGGSGYEAAQERKGGWQWSPVFERWVRLDRERDPLGEWSYRLRTRAERSS